MKDTVLGREVLDQADAHPDSFDMGGWAYASPRSECGTVACLAGWAMLKRGYTYHQSGAGVVAFYRPDGSFVSYIADEAEYLLGMADDDVYGGGRPIWHDMDDGLDRFRKLVEEAEGQA